jgi:hypothetical protein
LEESKKGKWMEANLYEEAVNDQVPNRCVSSLYTSVSQTGVLQNPWVPWASTKGSAIIGLFHFDLSKIYFYSTDLQHQPSRECSDTM